MTNAGLKLMLYFAFQFELMKYNNIVKAVVLYEWWWFTVLTEPVDIDFFFH